MKIKIDTKQILEISGTDKKCLENDLLSIEGWIKDAIIGKINNCKKRLIKEWQQKLMTDPNVDSIPANEDSLIELVTSRPYYENRIDRDEREEAERKAERNK